MKFDDSPILVFWETTRACDLACRHCRAEAMHEPAPGELTTEEGIRLVTELGRFGARPPVLVLTGGDVMARRDLLELVAAARAARLPVALAPSVTPRLTADVLGALAELGVSSVSLSLDGSRPSTHEGVRGIPGHFERTVSALHRLKAMGFRLQVNTAVMAANADELADIAAIVKEVRASAWELFFLVRVGRGRQEGELSAQDNEQVANFLFDASRYGFPVRAVEGPWCRRVATWRGAGVPVSDAVGSGLLYRRLSRRLIELMGPGEGPPRFGTSGTRDGKGILFIAHDGSVFPAGFLPVKLGNVRDESAVTIYREAPLLRSIRNAEFSGRCGRCEFRDLCGGSRARAWASSGDPLAEDPGCAYVPA